MGKQNMRLKKYLDKAVVIVAMVLVFPAAVFAAGPNLWTQRYDITVIVAGTVANYIQRYQINIVEPVHLSISVQGNTSIDGEQGVPNNPIVEIAAVPGAANPNTGSALVRVTSGGGSFVPGINGTGVTDPGWGQGYTLSVSGDTNLTCGTGGTIATMSGSGAMQVDRWGYGLGTGTGGTIVAGGNQVGGTTAPTTWNAMPASDTVIARRESASVNPNVGDPFNVFFGTRASATLKACKYVGEVTFTAVKIP